MGGGPAGRLPHMVLGTAMRPLGIHIGVRDMGTILHKAIFHRRSMLLRRIRARTLVFRFHRPINRPLHLGAMLLPCNSTNHKYLQDKVNNNSALLILYHKIQ